MANRLIPGSSLTTTPRNAAYENPPKIVDADEALLFYFEKLSDLDTTDSIMQLLENNISVQTVTEGLLRSNVSKGIHSIDVSMIIAPVIHEYIKGTADMVGVSYDEGEDFKEVDFDNKQIEAGKSMASSQMIDESFVETVIDEESTEEETAPPETSRGLMSRKTEEVV